MATFNVAINGLGRIGRTLLRSWLQDPRDINLVAINNPGDAQALAHLLKYDSLHGKLGQEVEAKNGKLNVGRHSFSLHAIKDPAEIPWGQDNVDMVIDATGIFKDKDSLSRHIRDSVKKVIMCAPGKDLDGTFVMGVNHTDYDPSQHHVVSNASCTTNCLAPVAKVLHEAYGIEQGLMCTIHSYTSDQLILDGLHKDPRRSRAAALSMVPTTTGAAKAVGLAIPELDGKLDGYAIRVPTPDVSLVDFSAQLKKAATKEEINNLLREKSSGELKGILGYCEEPLVSVDYMGNPASSTVDAALTNTIGNQVKVVSWYDNEVGFSHRVLDLANHMGRKL